MSGGRSSHSGIQDRFESAFDKDRESAASHRSCPNSPSIPRELWRRRACLENSIQAFRPRADHGDSRRRSDPCTQCAEQRRLLSYYLEPPKQSQILPEADYCQLIAVSQISSLNSSLSSILRCVAGWIHCPSNLSGRLPGYGCLYK